MKNKELKYNNVKKHIESLGYILISTKLLFNNLWQFM